MKPKPVSSSEAKDFLDAFNGSTRSTYASGLGVFLLFYKKKLADFLDELEADRTPCKRRAIQKFLRTDSEVSQRTKNPRGLSPEVGPGIMTRKIKLVKHWFDGT